MAVVILSKDNKSYSKGTSRLYITFDNIHVSVVNGLRRVITSNIPSLVFRGLAILITGGFLIPVRMKEFTWLGREKIF